jgi:hypothetical protein
MASAATWVKGSKLNQYFEPELPSGIYIFNV